MKMTIEMLEGVAKEKLKEKYVLDLSESKNLQIRKHYAESVRAGEEADKLLDGIKNTKSGVVILRSGYK